MQVNATQEVKVNLSDRELKRVILDGLYKFYNWDKDFYIKGNKVCEDFEQSCGVRSMTVTQVERDATDKDIEVYEMLKIIRKDLL